MPAREFLPAHPVGPSGQKYLDGLGEKERALHLLAVERLGSSYFVEKSHAYKKWCLTASATVAGQTTK